MLFNSIDFAIFLPIVFSAYWIIGSRYMRIQNIILFGASYIFYGWWDWRFLGLIFFSSSLDFFIGVGFSKTTMPKYRKALLFTSIITNLSVLCLFKYCNFFVENFVRAFTLLGMSLKSPTLNIILPMGISFYTFQTMSYTIDIFKKRIKPTRDMISYLGYVSFFPQLTAGPIEKASNLLHQFHHKRLFSYEAASDGMRQILWGFFKKIVIADNCAFYVNSIFRDYVYLSPSTLLLGTLLFSFQIYGDFSGYSDIAIGSARLFGFNLSQNFRFPYFSRSVSDFWRRWHISLSSWFKDYIYLPLGGNRRGELTKTRNIFVVFFLSGLWHGAAWHFIVWGIMHAFFLVPEMIWHSFQRTKKIKFPLLQFVQMILTFCLVTIAWVFFRMDSVTGALHFFSRLCSGSFFTVPEVLPQKELLSIALLLIVEWIQRSKKHGLDFRESQSWTIGRWGLYYAIIAMIVILGSRTQTFIYFQF